MDSEPTYTAAREFWFSHYQSPVLCKGLSKYGFRKKPDPQSLLTPFTFAVFSPIVREKETISAFSLDLSNSPFLPYFHSGAFYLIPSS